MFWSVALMLEHLGEDRAATAIMTATEEALSEGNLTADLGGKTSTMELARIVTEKV
jgi:tartrate dehydrogenase/decarboxylase/D-malate dehydrogenase